MWRYEHCWGEGLRAVFLCMRQWQIFDAGAQAEKGEGDDFPSWPGSQIQGEEKTCEKSWHGKSDVECLVLFPVVWDLISPSPCALKPWVEVYSKQVLVILWLNGRWACSFGIKRGWVEAIRGHWVEAENLQNWFLRCSMFQTGAWKRQPFDLGVKIIIVNLWS